MSNYFIIAHVVLGLVFVMFVLIQDKGAGLSAAFGGSGGFYASQRGVAKVVHRMTIVLAVLFFATALAATLTPVQHEEMAEPAASVSVEDVKTEGGEVNVETVPVQEAQ